MLRPTGVTAFAPDEIAFLEATANVLADAIERRRAEEEMQRQGLHDPLTGLPNRTLFMDRLSLALSHAVRRKTSVAVLFIDLDRFKLVNDSLGHGAGDELLCLLAVRLNEVLRPGDTVARFGGDEFCVICDDLADPELAISIAQRMTAALARPFALGTSEQFVSASVGIAVATDLDRTAEDLVGEADAAMYRAKENGRGGFELFDAVMRGHASERLRVENDLRRALELGDELIAHYQPIVTLAGGEIIGIEALARWNHPQRGLVSPGEFIPVAEESGAILAIGERVLRLACAEAARWNAATRGALSVSVNLSPRQVASPGIVATVAAVLDETGLAPALLTLEITEGVLVTESEATAQTLVDLKALGLRLVLDDFGTGYSSLAYLRRFPIDGLKIDRRFIAAMDTSTEDRTIVEAIIKMAAGLQIDVVAEGVETLEQAQGLIALGCHHAQGFYYARPMAPEVAADLFGARRYRLPTQALRRRRFGPEPTPAGAHVTGHAGGRFAPRVERRRRRRPSYMASSAAAMRSSSVSASPGRAVARPMLTESECSPGGRVCVPWRTRSQRSLASAADVPTSTAANSSPPIRATTSVWRSASRRMLAVATSALSPAAWPKPSLIPFSPSRSMNSTHSAEPSRFARSNALPPSSSRPRRL